jgi:NADPH:quinone reductase-like Zn-dependent oxidoreductase
VDEKVTFPAFKISDAGGKTEGGVLEATLDELSAGDVVIKTEYSSVNYKDALAATGAGKIIRRFPLIGGIDVAGTVASSTDARFSEDDRVLATGYDLGVSHDGGYAGYVNFGTSAFFGMGVYTAVFLVKAVGAPLAVQIAAAYSAV